MIPFQPMRRSLWSFWDRGTRVERTGYLVGVLLLASGVIHLGILVIGGGSWEGPLSLRKPAVFGLSFGVTLVTIVWTSSFLRLGTRSQVFLLNTFTAASIVETGLVSLQAWRGVPSHFNMETTADALVARALAAGGFALVAIIVVLTFAAFRRNPTVPISVRIAIQVGFVVLCGAMAIGGAMIARGMMLVFAGESARAYASGGALKPTHAVTMHAILVLPALAWLLSFADWTEQRRRRVVLWASAAYVGLAAVVAVGNLASLDLGQLPLPAEALAAIAGLAILSAGALALLGVARNPRARGLEHVASDV
jgi:hypothetical protein